jgi:adenylate cyclase
VRTPPLILVADDEPANVEILSARLAAHGYAILTAADGEEALAAARAKGPDLVLLDINMPRLDGLEVCRRLKADPALPFVPVILVTARTDPGDIVAGLEAGGDEYLTKPVDGAALVARVKSMLRIKALHDEVQAQAAQLQAWNATLKARVEEQVAQLDRLGRLKRFFSPRLAERILAGGADDPLRPHRREVVVVVLDVGGFTAFMDTADPEDVMGVLGEFHAAMGRLIVEHEGTVERFVGDAIFVLFNDPEEVPDPGARAVRMAVAMGERIAELRADWRKRGFDLSLSIGIAQGYATLGAIGFEGRWDYGAMGRVVYLAARLCRAAKAGQILVSSSVAMAVEHVAAVEEMPPLTGSEVGRPVPVFSVSGLRRPS